jgi:hypothetical protein
MFIPIPHFFLLQNNLLRKIMCSKEQFLEDLTLLIVKNHLPLQFVKSNWIKRFSMHLRPIIVFLSK